MSRRSFFRQLGGFGVATVAAPGEWAFAATPPAATGPLGLHPFVEAHPEAVFIRRTKVAAKTDAEAIRREALALAREVFTVRKGPGLALTQTVAIKPNLTSTKKTGLTHAIVTDPFVVEGLVDGLVEQGIARGSIFVREGLMVEQPTTGYPEMALRAGVHYGDDHSRTPTTKECPDGVVFRRTKYLGPFAYPDSFLINVAKHKTHSMGLTLCVKNLQGTNVPPYIRFCGGLNPALAADFQPDAQAPRGRALREAPARGPAAVGDGQGPRTWRCGPSARSTTTRSSSRAWACT